MTPVTEYKLPTFVDYNVYMAVSVKKKSSLLLSFVNHDNIGYYYNYYRNKNPSIFFFVFFFLPGNGFRDTVLVARTVADRTKRLFVARGSSGLRGLTSRRGFSKFPAVTARGGRTVRFRPQTTRSRPVTIVWTPPFRSDFASVRDDLVRSTVVLPASSS